MPDKPGKVAGPLSEDKLADVCRAPDADAAHASHVRGLCGELFARTAHLHGLTKPSLAMLRAAAIAACGRRVKIGQAALRRAFPDLAPAERKIVDRAAALVARDGRAHTVAESGGGGIAARIAAIVCVAIGLDHTRTHDTRIADVVDNGKTLDVLVLGSAAARENASAAFERARLWNSVMLRPIRSVAVRADKAPASALILPGCTIAEAARRIFQRQAEHFFSRTHGLQYGRDIEYVHEMRVALRRLRAALRVFRKAAGGMPPEFTAELKWLAGVLGQVRDADVFIAFLHEYAARARGGHQPFVQGLIRSVARKRRRRYGELRAAYESDRFKEFARTCRPTLARRAGKDGKKAASAAAPRLLLKRLKKATKDTRRLDRRTPEQQHAQRIECKKLRYAAGFFSDVYPGRLKEIVGAMIKMQDTLGSVHDADVYAERIIDHCERRRNTNGRPAGAKALLAHLRKRREKSLAKAALVWKVFTRKSALARVTDVIKSPMKG